MTRAAKPARFHFRDPGDPHPYTWRVIHWEDLAMRGALLDAAAVLVPEPTLTLRFEYPLSQPTTRTFTHAGGFTRLDIAQCVCEGYRAIYAEEEHGLVGEAPMIPGMLNRAPTHGPHGIWGHILDDLFLEGLVRAPDGTYRLVIGS